MYLSSSQRLHYKVVQIFLLLLIAIGASFSQYSTNAGKQYPPQNQQPPSSGHGSIPSTGNPLPPSQGPIPSGNGIPGGNIFPGSGIPSGNIFPGNGGACNPQQNQMGSQSNSPTPQSAGPVNILGGFPQSNGVSLGNDQTPSNSPSFGNGQMPSGEGGSYQQDASASVADFGPRGGFGFRRDDDFNNRDFDRPRWGDREADLGGVVAFRALFLRLAIAHLATFANTCQEHVFPAPATIACADSSNCQS
ncbi:hypothetical protein MDAP_001257 [Mitosporidium daphniae]